MSEGLGRLGDMRNARRKQALYTAPRNHGKFADMYNANKCEQRVQSGKEAVSANNAGESFATLAHCEPISG